MDARSFYTQIPRILPQTEQNRFFILACILYVGENDQALCPLYRKSENRNEPKTVEHEKFFVVAGMIREEDGRLRRKEYSACANNHDTYFAITPIRTRPGNTFAFLFSEKIAKHKQDTLPSCSAFNAVHKGSISVH